MKQKYGVTWDGSKFIGANADTANYRSINLHIGAFKFYEKQKDDRQTQQ